MINTYTGSQLREITEDLMFGELCFLKIQVVNSHIQVKICSCVLFFFSFSLILALIFFFFLNIVHVLLFLDTSGYCGKPMPCQQLLSYFGKPIYVSHVSSRISSGSHRHFLPLLSTSLPTDSPVKLAAVTLI